MKNSSMDNRQPPCDASVRSVAIAVAVFSVAILLLNGSFLAEGVSRLEYGTRAQIFWTRVLRPLDTLSSGLSLSSVREVVRDTAGNWLNSEE